MNSAWGTVGALRKHAKRGKEGAIAAGHAGQQGLRATFAAEIITRNGGVTPTDIERRIDQAVRAHSRVRKAAQTQTALELANAAINAIANPPAGCVYCYQPEPLPPQMTHKTCAYHTEQLKQELVELKRRLALR